MRTAVNDWSDQSRKRVKRTPEFMVYFLIIFMFAIPFSSVDWVVQVLRRRTLNLRGPLARAWAEAERVTPIIFSK